MMDATLQDVLDPPTRAFREQFAAILEGYANASGLYRGGADSLWVVNRFLANELGHIGELKNKRIIDFGCGSTRPLTAAVLFYLLGAESTLSVDVETVFDPAAVAVSIYGTIISIISGLSPLNIEQADADLTDVRRRAIEFDLAGLLSGQLHKSLPKRVRHEISRYQDLPDEQKTFDLMVSQSVFEHVADIGEVLLHARRFISDDGHIYAAVDFCDHRVYSQGLSPWQYLIDDSDHVPGYINKLRYSAMTNVIEDAGYEIKYCTTVQRTPPRDILERILPKFKYMSNVDLETIEARYVLSPKLGGRY